MIFLKNKKLRIGYFSVFLIVIILFIKSGPQNVWEILLHSNKYHILTAAFFMLLCVFLRFIKLFFSVKSKFKFKDLLIIYFMIRLFGNLLPSRVGEFAPMSEKQYRKKELAGFIAVDRLLETFATLILGSFGFYFFATEKNIFIIWIFFIFILILFMFILKKRNRIKDLIKDNSYDNKFYKTIVNVINIFIKGSDGILLLKNKISWLFVITMIVSLFDLIAAKFTLLSLGIDVSVIFIAFIWMMASIISVISILPSGGGFADISTFMLLVNSGVSSLSVTSFIILNRAIEIIKNLLFFIILYILKLEK